MNRLLVALLTAGLLGACADDGTTLDTTDPEPSPATTGTVDITITGLPVEVKADVELAGGPGAQARDVTASTAVETEAGSYTLTADPVEEGADRFLPDVERVDLDLDVGQTIAITVDYALETDETPTGEPTGQMVPGQEFDAFFGWSVAIDGDVAIVGAPNEGGYFSGAAHVYRRADGTWTLEDSFRIDDALERVFSAFGWDVAIQGTTAVVGAPGFDDDKGAVLVYEYDGAQWSAGPRLTCDRPSSPTASLEMGNAVDLDGDTIVATTPEFPSYSCIFRRSGATWTLEDAVDVGGDDVGLSGDAFWLVREGAPWVYTRASGSWSGVEWEITIDEQAWPARAVAHQADVVVLGHRTWPEDGTLAGRAFVVREGSGSPDVPLAPDPTAEEMRFGEAVALSEDLVVVGAPTSGSPATDGTAWVFDTSGSLLHRLEATDPDSDVAFGSAVAISDRTVVVGAWGHNVGQASDQGAVYFFELP